jgi:hypothetical protein
MTKRITSLLGGVWLERGAREIQPPQGGEASIAAERFENRSAQADNTDVSSIDVTRE